jgi:ribosomal-protein-alanine N-acetyltransferase
MKRLDANDLRLRPIQSSDSRRIHEWASDPRASVFQAWGPNTVADTERFVHGAIAAWSASPQARWVWVVEDTDHVVTGLGEVHLRDADRAEISYAVDVALWGQGFGSAAAQLLVVWAFDNLEVERVEATCDPRNVASDRILRRMGMTYEGTLRHVVRLADGWRDSEMFSILRDERVHTGR